MAYNIKTTAGKNESAKNSDASINIDEFTLTFEKSSGYGYLVASVGSGNRIQTRGTNIIRFIIGNESQDLSADYSNTDVHVIRIDNVLKKIYFDDMEKGTYTGDFLFTDGVEFGRSTPSGSPISCTFIQSKINDKILNFNESTGTSTFSDDLSMEFILQSDANPEYMWSYDIEEAPSTTSVDLREGLSGQGRITQTPTIDHAIGDTAKMWVQLRDTDVTPLETLIQSTDLANSVQIDRDNDIFVLTGYTISIVDTDDNVLTLPSEMVDKQCLVTMTATTATDVKYVGNDDTESTVVRGFIYDYKVNTVWFSVQEGTGNTLCSDKKVY